MTESLLKMIKIFSCNKYFMNNNITFKSVNENNFFKLNTDDNVTTEVQEKRLLPAMSQSLEINLSNDLVILNKVVLKLYENTKINTYLKIKDLTNDSVVSVPYTLENRILNCLATKNSLSLQIQLDTPCQSIVEVILEFTIGKLNDTLKQNLLELSTQPQILVDHSYMYTSGKLTELTVHNLEWK